MKQSSAGTIGGSARLDRLYLAHAGASVKLARLLSADPLSAKTSADTAFVRTVALFRDLRNPLSFEAALKRAVIRACRPPLSERLGSSAPKAGDPGDGPLWESFSNLPHRKKAALALRYSERMSDDGVADILGCSTGAARALVNKGLDELKEDGARSDPARTAGELVRLFERRTKGSVPVETERSVLRRSRFRRVVTVVGLVAVIASGAVAGFLVVS